MSVLGDRIIAAGPVRAGDVRMIDAERPSAAEWNELRQELIDLRAQVETLTSDYGKLNGAFILACRSRDFNRDALQELRAQAGAAVASGEARHYTPVAGGLRPCPICQTVKIGPTLVECTSCAGREDAAAKRREDQ